MEIRSAALKLLDMTAVEDLRRASFTAGGGVILESLKIARCAADREWQAGECPSYDPAKVLHLCGIPLSHDNALPVTWLSVHVDGRYVAGAYVEVSAGCIAGIAAPKVKPEAVEEPEKPKPFVRKRGMFSK